MVLEKWNQWLLLVGHFALIAGLMLVAIQINQENEIARLQLFSDAATSRIALQIPMLGENPAPTVVKSLTEPESLSLEELRVMDAYFVSALNEIRRDEVLKRLDVGVDREVSFENLVLFYFGNRFGQQWWREFLSEGEELNDLNRRIDELVRSADPDMTLGFFSNLQRRLKE